MKKALINCIFLVGIGTIVTITWRCLEIVMIGHVNPNEVDTIVGIILTFSLYWNFKNWIKRCKEIL